MVAPTNSISVSLHDILFSLKTEMKRSTSSPNPTLTEDGFPTQITEDVLGTSQEDIRKLDHQEAAQQQKLNMPKSGFCYRSLRMIKERKNIHCWLLQSEPGQDSDIQF